MPGLTFFGRENGMRGKAVLSAPSSLMKAVRRVESLIVTMLVTIAVVTLIAIPMASTSAAAAGDDWQVSASYPASLSPDGISCPTTADCFAVGADEDGGVAVLATTDGGASWASQMVPAGDGQLNAISCTSPTDCIAVGQEYNHSESLVVETDDGGGSWVNASNADSLFQVSDLYGISCSSGFNCIITGVDTDHDGVIGTISDAQCCSVDSAPSGEGTYFGVTCASSTGCYAAGINGVVASTNGGLTWATQSVPSGTGALSDVACSSPSDCIAVGGVPSGGGSDVILATTDGGTNWASQTAPAGVSDLYGVSCPPPSSECYAVGQSGDNSNPAGAIISSSDGGITWTSQNSPASLSEFGGVDCPDALTCFAVGEGPGTIVATTNGGVDWTDEGVPSGVNKPNAIACPSSSDCYAVGDGNGVDGVILASTNGGSSWSSQAVPVGATDLYGIACPSVSDCTAVGLDEQNETEVILATTDSGATWTSETAPPDLGILTAISCPSPSACFAVGNAVASGLPVAVVTADAGATWTVETVPSTTGNFSSIACASPTDCQAVGVFQESGTNSYFPLLGTTDGGTTWTFESLGENVGTAENLATVACPSVSDCYAIGGIIGGAIEIFATTDGGLDWVDEPLPSGTQYLPVATFGNEGIACPSASVCYADAPAPTSSAVLATIDGGETWTSESLPSDSGSLTTIACPSVSECFAAGLGDSSPDDGGLILSGTDLDPLSVGTASLPTGAVYGPYWASLTAVGGMSPYTWSITSGVLPVGLSLDSTTGSIEGTPTKAGASSLTVGATDSSSPALTATADLTITIERRLAIAKASLPQGITGQSYNGALTASGGLPPYSWSATSLPAGLSIDSSTGFITGTPLTSGKYPVTFGVTSSDNQEVEKSGSPD